MTARIARHQAERGPGWRTVECPIGLAGSLIDIDKSCRDDGAAGDTAILVDCLTLWLSNIMLANHDVPDEIARLVAVVAALATPTIFVSNEVGLGIVPDNALARRFRDAQGLLNQEVAEVVGQVEFIAAGLPLRLKP